MAQLQSCFIVTIHQGSEITQKIVDAPSFTVGRAFENLLSFNDLNISRSHIQVQSKKKQIYIEDLGSANGTWLGGQKIPAKKMIALQPNQKIKLGASNIELSFSTLEKSYRKEELKTSDLTQEEKNVLIALIEGAHAEAERLQTAGQQIHQQIVAAAENKAVALLQKAQMDAEEHKKNLLQKNQILIDELLQKSKLEIEQRSEEIKQQVRLEAQKETQEESKRKLEDFQKNLDNEKVLRLNKFEQNLINEKQSALKEIEDLKLKTESEKELFTKQKETFKSALEKEKSVFLQQQENLKSAIKKEQSIFLQQQTNFKQETELLKKQQQDMVLKLNQEFKDKSDLLEKEYNNKQSSAKEKINILESDYKSKSNQLELDHETRTSSLNKEFQNQEFEFKKQHDELMVQMQKEKNDLRLELDLLQKQFTDQKLQNDLRKSNYENDWQQKKNLHEKELERIAAIKKQENDIYCENLIKAATQQQKEIEKNTQALQEQTKLQVATLEQQAQERVRSLEQQAQEKILHLEQQTQEKMRSYEIKKEAELQSIFKEKESKLHFSLKEKENQFEAAKQDYDSQTAALKISLQKEKDLILQTHEKNKQELQYSAASEAQKIRDQWFESLFNEKQRIAQEITIMLHSGGHPADGTDKSKIETQIIKILEQNTSSLNPTAANSETDTTYSKKVKNEKIRFRIQGLSLGFVIFFTCSYGYKKFLNDSNPLKTAATEAIQQRNEDLLRRKFNPTQTTELKESYTDAVIYTENYVMNYLNEDFQKNWLKAATDYLFKQWRIEEEKTVQLLSSVNTLVKTLNEKKEQIHPDYIEKDIKKMHDLEAEKALELQNLLGSQVKYEAFRRFEKKFYLEQIPWRNPAQSSESSPAQNSENNSQ
ncbi:MAG: FHA domain-containing protein [Pseudobdellovibrionaceae bacterium]